MDIDEEFDRIIDGVTRDDLDRLIQGHLAQLLSWRDQKLAMGVTPTLRMYTMELMMAAQRDPNPRAAWTSILCGFAGMIWERGEQSDGR